MTSMLTNKASEMPASPATSKGIAVILLGPPGCGKGTQARELSKSFGFVHLSTGDLLRATASTNSELGYSVQARMRAGELVPDQVISRIIADRISPAALDSGLVLDGYPRTLQQTRFLCSLLHGYKAIAWNLQLSQTLLIQRVIGRLTCSACGEIYNAFFKRPRSNGFCDRDGQKLEQRLDDTEDTIRRRLICYEKETQPVIEHLRKMNILHDIQADLDSTTLSRHFHEKLRLPITSRFLGNEKPESDAGD
jgi:adenylate kinase